MSTTTYAIVTPRPVERISETRVKAVVHCRPEVICMECNPPKDVLEALAFCKKG
jgi:hypothetical protein